MNRQQIAQLYDSFPEGQKDMPKEQFINRMIVATDPTRMARDADAIVQGRLQKGQIDAALRKENSET